MARGQCTTASPLPRQRQLFPRFLDGFALRAPGEPTAPCRAHLTHQPAVDFLDPCRFTPLRSGDALGEAWKAVAQIDLFEVFAS